MRLLKRLYDVIYMSIFVRACCFGNAFSSDVTELDIHKSTAIWDGA